MSYPRWLRYSIVFAFCAGVTTLVMGLGWGFAISAVWVSALLVAACGCFAAGDIARITAVTCLCCIVAFPFVVVNRGCRPLNGDSINSPERRQARLRRKVDTHFGHAPGGRSTRTPASWEQKQPPELLPQAVGPRAHAQIAP